MVYPMLVKSFPKKKKGEKMVKKYLMQPNHEEYDVTPIEDVENIVLNSDKPLTTNEVIEKSLYKYHAVTNALKTSNKITNKKEKGIIVWFNKQKKEEFNKQTNRGVVNTKVALGFSGSGVPQLTFITDAGKVTVNIKQDDFYNLEMLLL